MTNYQSILRRLPESQHAEALRLIAAAEADGVKGIDLYVVGPRGDIGDLSGNKGARRIALGSGEGSITVQGYPVYLQKEYGNR